MNEEEYLAWFDEKIRDYAMFSTTGNKKAHAIAKKLIKKIFSKRRIEMDVIIDLAGKELAKAYLNKKTSEILDSEPPYHIWFYANKAVKIAKYDWDWETYDLQSKVWDHVKLIQEKS
jgi:hypothetical protein